MADSSVRGVLMAVHTLYYDPDPAQKKQADQALKSFQKTSQAWQTCHTILQLPDSSTEALWFAASTLYFKVSSSYSELGPGDRIPFRDAVLTHLSRHIKGNEIVLTQLSLAIATLAVHMQEWAQPVEQLVSMLNGGQGDTGIALMHILTVLPEECDSISSRSRQAASPRADSLCSSVAEQVLALLANLLRQSPDIRMQRMVLRCLLSWVRYAFTSLSQSVVLSSSILGDCFQAVSVPDISQVACDVIVALIIFASRHEHATLAEQLAGAVLSLWPVYAGMVQEEDSLGGRVILQVFMQLAESNVGWVISQAPQGRSILQLVVNSTPNPDPELSILTFNFWYVLAGNMEAMRQDLVRVSAVGAAYRDDFLAAIDNIRRVIEFPSDFDGLTEQDEEHKRFRYAAADALLDISSFFDSSLCLEYLVMGMQSCLAEYRANPLAWQRLEACLYSIRSMARNIKLGEENNTSNSLLPRVMTELLSMTAHPLLRYTATMIIGRYSDWVAAHPTSIDPLLRFVVEGLSFPASRSAAAMAFKFICESCAQHLAANSIEAVIQVYCGMGALDMDDQSEIIEGVCAVVCVRPADSIAVHLRQLINPVLQAISQHVRAVQQQHSVDTNVLLVNIDRLAQLFKSIHLDNNTELADIINSMWPLLEQLFNLHARDEKIMERACRLVKYCLRATHAEFPAVEALITVLTRLYQNWPWSCFIYTCAVTIDEFSRVPRYHPLFGQAVSVLAQKSLEMLGSIEQITDNPTICEDFFNLQSRCITDLTPVAFTNGMLAQSLACAILGVRIQHREAARAVFMFMRNLLTIGETFPGCRSIVHAMFENNGEFLFRILITHLLEDLSRNRMRDLIEVVHAALALDKIKSAVFLERALESLPPTVPNRAQFATRLLAATTALERREAILKFENDYQAEGIHVL